MGGGPASDSSRQMEEMFFVHPPPHTRLWEKTPGYAWLRAWLRERVTAPRTFVHPSYPVSTYHTSSHSGYTVVPFYPLCTRTWFGALALLCVPCLAFDLDLNLEPGCSDAWVTSSAVRPHTVAARPSASDLASRPLWSRQIFRRGYPLTPLTPSSVLVFDSFLVTPTERK